MVYGLPIEPLKVLAEDSKTLRKFHHILMTVWKGACRRATTNNAVDERQDQSARRRIIPKCGNRRDISLVVHTGKALFKKSSLGA